MYTQALNTADAEERNIEDAAQSAQFQARIDADERIEPNDWMPAAYRKTLTRQISVEEPLTDPSDIYRLACFLLGREKLVSRPLRLLGVGVANLREPSAEQLVLL